MPAVASLARLAAAAAAPRPRARIQRACPGAAWPRRVGDRRRRALAFRREAARDGRLRRRPPRRTPLARIARRRPRRRRPRRRAAQSLRGGAASTKAPRPRVMTTRRRAARVAKGRRPSRATPPGTAEDVVDAVHVAADACAGRPLERAVVADAEAGAVEHRHRGGAAQRGPVLLVLLAGARRVASSLPAPPQQADEPRAVAMRRLRRRARAGGRRARGVARAGPVARADGDRPAEEPVLRVANLLGPRAGDALPLRTRAPERGGLPAFGAADRVVVAGREPAGERAVEAPAAVELPAVPRVVAVGHG